jgi:hypothetical protein
MLWDSYSDAGEKIELWWRWTEGARSVYANFDNGGISAVEFWTTKRLPLVQTLQAN